MHFGEPVQFNKNGFSNVEHENMKTNVSELNLENILKIF